MVFHLMFFKVYLFLSFPDTIQSDLYVCGFHGLRVGFQKFTKFKIYIFLRLPNSTFDISYI